MAETWLKSCTRVPYPSPLTRLDQYSSTSGVPHGGSPYSNEMRGVILHSAEGYFSGTNTPNAVMRARGNSWTITIYRSGKKEQHFPLEAMCWHAGRKANYRFIGIEHEGRAGEALTSAQLAATIEVCSEIARLRGWISVKYGVTGFEHNDFMATACPSRRIPWSKVEAGTKAADFWSDVIQISKSVTLYQDTNLVKLPNGVFVKKLLKGTKLAVKGRWKTSHYITVWSFDNRVPNGFAVSATIPPPTPTDPCKTYKDQITALQIKIDGLQTKIGQQSAQINEMSGTISSQTATIATLNQKISTAEAQLAAANTDLIKSERAKVALKVWLDS